MVSKIKYYTITELNIYSNAHFGGLHGLALAGFAEEVGRQVVGPHTLTAPLTLFVRVSDKRREVLPVLRAPMTLLMRRHLRIVLQAGLWLFSVALSLTGLRNSLDGNFRFFKFCQSYSCKLCFGS